MISSETWVTPTLETALAGGYTTNFAVRYPVKGNTDKAFYQCTCGHWTLPACFVDVRTIPQISGNFLCDGCMSTMERNHDNLANTNNSRADFMQDLLQLLGAPSAIYTTVGRKYDQDGNVILGN